MRRRYLGVSLDDGKAAGSVWLLGVGPEEVFLGGRRVGLQLTGGGAICSGRGGGLALGRLRHGFGAG